MRKSTGIVTTSLMLFPVLAMAGASGNTVDSGRRSSVVQRSPVGAPVVGATRGASNSRAKFPREFRSIDGVGNNVANPTWGAAGVMLLRKAPNEYEDGSQSPARPQCKSAREISNLLSAQTGDMPNSRRASDFLWQWGQFLDHDIDETPVGSSGDTFDIEVPIGDPWFDPNSLGNVTIPMDRSAGRMQQDVRQQLNNITAFIDASNVYGSDSTRAHELRTLDGTGRLQTSAGDLLPFNTAGLPNAPTGADPSLFLAGDVRANEQVALTAMHTLFMREHNYWADRFHHRNPRLSGDAIYNRARAIVGAEIQAITYNEFLPLLLGKHALPHYHGYRDDVNVGISNEFSTGGYRVGHTMLSSTIRRIDNQGNSIPAGDLPLARAFFTPAQTIEHGIDPVLRGLASNRSQEIDVFVVDDVRNLLFGAPGSGGFDLVALNIQRGRDHGLPSHNGLRECFGLAPMTSFAQVTPDKQMQAQLAAAYKVIGDMDPWVGLLIEEHVPGSMVGETLQLVLVDQFTRLRDGDRFWYESYLPPRMVAMVNSQRLSRIIKRNTDIGSEVRRNVFRVRRPCVADLNDDNSINARDLTVMLANFGGIGGEADLNDDEIVDASDLALLLAKWGRCN